MAGSKIQSFDLFKAAMGNPGYLTEINKSIATQAHFVATLEKGHLTPQELLESIQVVQNQQVKSLLITYLLSRKEYLECLKGESLLKRLSVHENHTPSRLNALVHQLDLKTLTTSMISKLQPEAAASILCSVPHFHQLTRTQTEALIGRYPKHELIVYWMNHFSSMPNAHHTLAHLMKLAGTNVLDVLSKMESNQKEEIITNIIEHLGLFNISQRFLEHANKESHLLLAIRLYLNGHYNKVYAIYINQLTKKLLDKNYPFSLSAIELIFFLNDKLAFKELANGTAYLTNCYLRNNAQEGNIALFYQNNRINIQRMIQNINLNPVVPGRTKEQTQKQLENPEKNPFIEGLIKRNKSVNCFEYFLVHYKGSSESISKLLHDYMEFYEQPENSRTRSQAIHHIGFMLTRPELDTTVKEAIFTAFLNHPTFFDQQISYQLFLFDAKRIIRYFGLRGGKDNYQRVVDICTLALKNLNSQQNQAIIEVAQKALSEAQLELSFTKEQGFFSSLFKLIKRCWIYGWTGFFKPNSPEYVASESLNLEENHKKSSGKRVKQFTVQASEKDLPTLLDEIYSPLTKENFEDIIKALELYSLQATPREELATRQKLHSLYHQVMDKTKNTTLYRWLKDNQNPFINNQFRLLELVLKEKSRSEVDLLLTQVNEDSDHLQYVFDELNCMIPELVVKDPQKPVKSSEAPELLASTTKVVSEYATSATEYATSALSWAECWAEGFFTKMKSPPREEEEGFVVEHVESFHATMRS